MGDENPIRTLGDYSRPSHEGYRNTIELLEGNNVVPLRSDTIRLVQNGCSFHGLRSEDPNQHLKDFLKLVDSLDLDVANRERTRLCLFQFSLRDQASNWLERLPAGSISTWEDLTTRFLAQFFPPRRTAKLRNDILIWNGPRDFAKPVKAISLPRDVSSTSDCHFIELENQVQRLMEAHLAPKQPVYVNKITSSSEICSSPHDTQYCMENPEQAFVDYASSRTNEARGLPEKEEQDEKENPENINTNPSSPPDPSVSFIPKKVCTKGDDGKPGKGMTNLVPQSSDTEFVCTKGDDGDMMFIMIIKKNDDSHKEEPEVGENTGVGELEVEYFDVFPTRSELAYHKYLMYGPTPSIFLRNLIIIEGCSSNLKIPCNIGHMHIEKAYIDLNSPLNIDNIKYLILFGGKIPPTLLANVSLTLENEIFSIVL
ncbi:MAK10-like protein [Tanacetum coccineum]